MTKITKAVILCGGYGTRLLPITKSLPKEMLPIYNKPILQIILEQLKDAGIKEVLIIVGRGKESIINHFDKNIELETLVNLPKEYNETNLEMDIFFKRQGTSKGTGHALMQAKAFTLNSPFILCFGDEFFYGENPYKQIIDSYYISKKNIIALKKVNKYEVSKYGIATIKEKDNSFLIDDFIEKPRTPPQEKNYAFVGIGAFNKTIYSALKTIKEDEIRLTDGFYEIINKNNLYGCEVKADRFDIGNAYGLLKANIFLGLKDITIKKDLKNFIVNLLD